MLYEKPLTLLDLKFFGSLCYASTLEQNRSKLDLRANKCIFLGFKFGTKGYIVFYLHTREISVSRNVMFYEHVFPYSINVATHPTSVSTSPIASDFFNFLLDPLLSHSQPAPESLNPINNSNNPIHIPILSASQPVSPEAVPLEDLPGPEKPLSI